MMCLTTTVITCSQSREFPVICGLEQSQNPQRRTNIEKFSSRIGPTLNRTRGLTQRPQCKQLDHRRRHNTKTKQLFLQNVINRLRIFIQGGNLI